MGVTKTKQIVVPFLFLLLVEMSSRHKTLNASTAVFCSCSKKQSLLYHYFLKNDIQFIFKSRMKRDNYGKPPNQKYKISKPKKNFFFLFLSVFYLFVNFSVKRHIQTDSPL